MRSNHSEKNVDSGGFVRRRDLEHHDPAARPHDARHLAQAALEVGEVARAEADRRGVERVVGVRAAPARWPAPSAGRGAFGARALEHALGEVRADDLAAARARSSIARSPVPVATSSARAARPDARQVGRALAPAVVQPRRHDRVHDVVDAGDAIEHRPDLPLLEACRLPPQGCASARRS